MYRSLLSLALVPLMFACGEVNEDSWFPGCDETTTVLDIDEVSNLGFSGTELFDALGGIRTYTGEYDIGGTAETTETLTLGSGDVLLVERVESQPPEGFTGAIPAIAVICDDTVQVPVDVTVSTDDGTFEESATAVLEGSTVDRATWSAEIAAGGLSGSFDESTVDTSRYDTWGYTLSGTRSDVGDSGELVLIGEGETPDTAFAEATYLLTWNDAE